VDFINVFLLVFFAEFGDKSQLVCMTLSTRYRAFPVFIGSCMAFAILNLLAVLFGVALNAYLPKPLILFIVGMLFLVFGVQSFVHGEDEGTGKVKVGKHLLISVFILIFLAELGDKTQLAVAGLAAVGQAWVIWLASTLALGVTTLIGVWFGRVLLKKISTALVHRGAGILFMLFSGIAFFQLYQSLV
jgi:putative Ca2+/H+ antiporter (TMEM165/GDT1 family)